VTHEPRAEPRNSPRLEVMGERARVRNEHARFHPAVHQPIASGVPRDWDMV
jgi:hypothetical protein